MSNVQYAIFGYAISIVLLWGYALSLYIENRRLIRMEQLKEGL